MFVTFQVQSFRQNLLFNQVGHDVFDEVEPRIGKDLVGPGGVASAAHDEA